MVVTGLEVGGIVVGCVNAGLGAAKLIMDWRNKKKERKQVQENLKLEQKLRSDASSIKTTYTHHLQKLRKSDRRKFEKGDQASVKELERSSTQLQNAMRDLRRKIRNPKSSVIPDMARFITASKTAHEDIVRSLVRLYKRVELEVRVPRSLNPLNLFKRHEDKLHTNGKPDKIDRKGQNNSLSNLANKSVPDTALHTLLGDAPAGSSTSNLLALVSQLPWEVEAPVPAPAPTPGSPCAGHANACTCAAKQVIVVGRIYVNQSKKTVKSPRRTLPKDMEVVLVRRRKR